MLRSSGGRETYKDNVYLYYNIVCNRQVEMSSKHIRLYSLPKSLFLKRQCKDKAQQKVTHGIQSKMIDMMLARTQEEGTSFSFISADYSSLGP